MKSIFNYNDYERDRFVAEMAQTLPAGTRVLDAGAGPCRYKHLFSHCEYKAQDFGLYTGKEHMYGALDYIGDITAIDAPDGTFDFILCTEVLEHIPRPDLAVMEFARLLRPGGGWLLQRRWVAAYTCLLITSMADLVHIGTSISFQLRVCE